MNAREHPHGHDPLEVAFSNDADLLPFSNEMLGLPMLQALIVSGQFPQILITNNENRCVLCDSVVDLTSRGRGDVRGLTPRNCQCTCKYENFTK